MKTRADRPPRNRENVRRHVRAVTDGDVPDFDGAVQYDVYDVDEKFVKSTDGRRVT